MSTKASLAPAPRLRCHRCRGFGGSEAMSAAGQRSAFRFSAVCVPSSGIHRQAAGSQRQETLRYPSRPTPKHSGRLRRRERLARLHIDYGKLEPYPLKFVETPTVAASSPRHGAASHGGVKPPPQKPLSYRVEDKLRLSKDRRSLKINDTLTLAGTRRRHSNIAWPTAARSNG